jgi:phage terminase Nu1 subunit (DNA packaging protein)
VAEHSSSERVQGLVDRRELARQLGVSHATVTRLTREGAPVIYVGQSPRYDVAAFRAWLGERGRREAKAAPARRDNIPGVRLLSRPRS